MIKDNQTRLNRLHVLLDALVIAAAYVFSWFITLKSGLFGADLEAGILPTLVLYAGPGGDHTGLSAFVYSLSSVYAKAGAGQTTGICQHLQGQYHRTVPLWNNPLFRKKKSIPEGILSQTDGRLLPDQHYSGDAGAKPDPYRAAFHAREGIQSETYYSGGLQPRGRRLH